MNFKQLYYFAAQCLALDTNPEHEPKTVSMLVNKHFPIENFIRLCDCNYILPAVYLKFRSHNLLKYLPQELQLHLAEIYTTNKTRNEKIYGQLSQICWKFQEADIEPVFLKGTAHLLNDLYSDIGERMIGDIDLLVQEKDYLFAVGQLEEVGYENNSVVFDDVKTLKHYPRLFRKDAPADIEVHRLPVPEKYIQRLSSESIIRNSRKTVEPSNAFVPSGRHMLVHNFIHNQLVNSGYLFKKTSLRDLYDFHLLSLKPELQTFLSLYSNEDSKFSAYFHWMRHVFYYSGRLPEQNDEKDRIHIFLMNSSLEYPEIQRLCEYGIKIIQLITLRYLGRIIKSVYNKKSRKYILVRIKNPLWFKIHLKGLKRYF